MAILRTDTPGAVCLGWHEQPSTFLQMPEMKNKSSIE
jgi:hypothetical protein